MTIYPVEYPERIKYPANKVYPNETNSKIIRGRNFGTLTLSFIKKTILCPKFIPCLYPETRKCLSLQPKETNRKR